LYRKVQKNEIQNPTPFAQKRTNNDGRRANANQVFFVVDPPAIKHCHTACHSDFSPGLHSALTVFI